MCNMLRKASVSLKWPAPSAGEISRLNMIAHISKNIRIQENGLIFPNTPQWDLLFGSLKRTKFKNVMVLYLTENNLSVKWRLLYCVSSRLCTVFWRISDSRFTWVLDFEELMTDGKTKMKLYPLTLHLVLNTEFWVEVTKPLWTGSP